MIVLIFDDKSIKKVEEKAEEKVEKKLPKYIVPKSNFTERSRDKSKEAMIIGVACEVVSEPYKVKVPKLIGPGLEEQEVINVVSLLTGIKYTIPYDIHFYRGYNSRSQAIYDSSISYGQYRKNEKSLIGSIYYPRDNSYICDFEGNFARLYKKPCKVVSIPFDSVVKCAGEKYIYKFILVEYEGKIYRTLFGEWGFYE